MEKKTLKEIRDTAIILTGMGVALTSEAVPEDFSYHEITYHGLAISGLVIAAAGIGLRVEAYREQIREARRNNSNHS